MEIELKKEKQFPITSADIDFVTKKNPKPTQNDNSLPTTTYFHLSSSFSSMFISSPLANSNKLSKYLSKNCTNILKEFTTSYHKSKGNLNPLEWISKYTSEVQPDIDDDIFGDPIIFLYAFACHIGMILPCEGELTTTIKSTSFPNVNNGNTLTYCQSILSFLIIILMASNSETRQDWGKCKNVFHNPIERSCSLEIDHLTFLIQKINTSDYKGAFPGKLIYRHDLIFTTNEIEESILRFTIGYRTM